MFKKNLIALLLISFGTFSFASDGKVKEEKLENNLTEVNYENYSSYSELVEDIGKKYLNKIFVFPSRNINALMNLEAISRMGDVSENEELRKDVDDYINSIDLNKKEKALTRDFAEIIQSLMSLTPRELINTETLVLINIHLLSRSLCMIKISEENKNKDKLFNTFKKIEIITLNNPERREHYQLFENITKFMVENDEKFMEHIISESQELCILWEHIYNKENK